MTAFTKIEKLSPGPLRGERSCEPSKEANDASKLIFPLKCKNPGEGVANWLAFEGGRVARNGLLFRFGRKSVRPAIEKEIESRARNCARCLSNQRVKETEQRSRCHDHRLRIDYILFAILRYNFIPSIGFGARRPGY